MKCVMRGLALAAALLVPVVTQAEIVLDTFTSAASTGVVGATRSSLTGTNSLASFGSGNLQVQASAVGGFREFTLTFAPTINGLGFSRWLELRDLIVVGDWSVTLSALGGGLGGAGTMTQTVADNSTSATLDLVNLTNVGHINSLSSLKVRFENLTDNGGFRSLTIGEMAAVPEPASMLLLGSTAIGGLIFNRRRKKALAA